MNIHTHERFPTYNWCLLPEVLCDTAGTTVPLVLSLEGWESNLVSALSELFVDEVVAITSSYKSTFSPVYSS